MYASPSGLWAPRIAVRARRIASPSATTRAGPATGRSSKVTARDADTVISVPIAVEAPSWKMGSIWPSKGGGGQGSRSGPGRSAPSMAPWTGTCRLVPDSLSRYPTT